MIRQSGANGHLRWFMALCYSSPLLLALLVYGYALTMPYFLDDGPHFAILAQTDGLRHWGDFPPFPFYRPFTFSLWKLIGVFGYSAPFMHWLNVLCFGVAGVLVGQLARRFVPDQMRLPVAVFAGWVFVMFPFSYQAVVMIAALFHLTLALGALLSLWAALLLIDGQRSPLLYAVFGLGAFVAVFSHETGVLLLPLLAGLLLLRQRAFSGLGWRLLLFVGGLALIYLLLWLRFSPRDDTGLTQDLPAGLAVLAQGLAYPLARGLRPFITGDLAPEWLLLMVVLLAGLLLLLLRWRNAHLLPVALFGLGWYLLAIFPAALLLSADYVLGQPRLALFAAAGGAIFWAVTLAGLFSGRGRWLLLIPALLMLAISLEFLGMRKAEFIRLRDFNRELVQLAELSGTQNTGALLINMPDYITPPEAERRFLLGTEGVLFVDETLDYAQQIKLNSERQFANIETIAVPSLQRSSGYNFRAHPPALEGQALIRRVRRAGQIIMTQFNGRDFSPVLVGGRDLQMPATEPALAEFAGGDFWLEAALLDFDPARDRLTLRLRWRADEPDAVKAFVHVLCDGQMVAQSDGYAWGDTFPFAAWEPGAAHTDIRHIPLPESVNESCLTVLVGLYTEAEVLRLPALNPATGEVYSDDAVPIRS